MAQAKEEVLEAVAEAKPETVVAEGTTELNPKAKPAKAKETLKLGNGTVQENY
jgi:hypothetical protein